jgi:hypothetical protein
VEKAVEKKKKMLVIYFQPFRNVVGDHYTIWLITKVVFHCLSLPLLFLPEKGEFGSCFCSSSVSSGKCYEINLN